MYSFGLNERKITVFFAIGLLIAFVPFFFAFGGKRVIFVDDDASGKQDGSWNHPYKTIDKALDKANSGDEVRVKKGKYRENITIPNGVKLVSDSGKRSDVVIDGDRKNTTEATVTMKNNATLSSVTIEDGKYGIKVKKDAKVHIYDVMVDSAETDGIYLEQAKLWETRRALLDEVTVKRSGRAGLYSESRFVVILDSNFQWNASDGVSFAAGVKGWMESTNVFGNKGSGWKVVIDNGETWTNMNRIYDNGREGVEIESFGASGKFGLKRAKVTNNGRYGVSLVARNEKALDMWKSVFLEGNSVSGNGVDQVSSVLLVR